MTRFANVGFVGCGSHSTNNLYPMLKYARARLQAVCDVDEQLARRNARVYGGLATYTNLDQMLAEEQLDGVLVCGPPQMHYEVGHKVLQQGIPLFVEKPPAPTYAETQDLVELAERNNTTIMTGFMKRHALTYARIREFIQAGRFLPDSGSIRYNHWPGDDIEGMLLGMSIHPIDLAISFFGDVTEVLSCTNRQNGRLSMGVTLRFDSGSWVQLNLGSSVRIQERVEITGIMDGKPAAFYVDNIHHMEMHTQGMGGVDLVDHRGLPDLFEIEPKFDLADIQVWRPDFAIPNMGQNSPFITGYAGEIREFANAILENREPNPGTQDTLKAMRVIDALLSKPDGTTTLR